MGTDVANLFRNFYPRPLRGGRRGKFEQSNLDTDISIHALCEEGDPKTAKINANSNDFYPRPLRGGRRAKAAIEDADEMNVDQAYRLTLLELNVSDTDDTENT